MNSNELKHYRVKRGMSVSELARRANLNRITIRNIEEGLSNPKSSTIAAICCVLEMDPNEIFFSNNVNHEEQKQGV